jgi:hypothetical protein
MYINSQHLVLYLISVSQKVTKSWASTVATPVTLTGQDKAIKKLLELNDEGLSESKHGSASYTGDVPVRKDFMVW